MRDSGHRRDRSPPRGSRAGGADGHADDEGRPSPLLGAVVATTYRPEIRYRRPPDAGQRLGFPALARVARRRGLHRVIDRYLDLETHPSAEAGLGRLPERVMRPVESSRETT